MGRSLEYWTSWPIIGYIERGRERDVYIPGVSKELSFLLGFCLCSFWRHAATGLFPSLWSFFENCTDHARWKILAQQILIIMICSDINQYKWIFIYIYMHVYVVNCCNWFWSSWKSLSNLSILFCFLPATFCIKGGSEVPPCSARNVPGFGWRHAFGSKHPPPGVIDQANGLYKDACRCLAHLGTIKKQQKTFVKHCQDKISTIRWFQQHHAPPSVQKPVKSSPPEPFYSWRHPAVGHRPFAVLHWGKPSPPPSQPPVGNLPSKGSCGIVQPERFHSFL